MHCLAAELMIRMLMFQIVGAGKSDLMAGFLAGACRTIVPIFHIEATAEAHVLVSPLLNHI
jgi:hypothetical protein